MPDFKEIAKSGWHPKGKDGKGESWRSDFKGVNQVAGWLGKGKDTGSSIPAEYHTSRPLSSLQDPASFGPPPKHIHTTQPNQATPDTTGFVAPSGKGELQQETATEGTKPRPPPVPFRIDTTGLSTSHLPPPPKRKGGGADAKTPLPQAPKPKPPVLPPRLSSRLGPSPVSSLPQKVFQEPDAHKGILNQDSLRRLGAAGVSVPTLGIGPPSADSLVQTQSAPTNNAAQLNELQSRFSRLSSNIPGPGIPEGTSLVHKQKALKPPPQYRKDLSSPLPSDPRSEQPAGLGKKKPPPPPVKKASLLSSASSIDTTPPPIPLSSKPNPQSVELDAQDLDLDLKSLWFAKSPPSFPPASINRLPGSRSFASSSGWTSSGVRKTHTFTGAIRHCNTLATTIIHLTWDSSNPGVTIKAQQRHIPPPRKLTREELDINRDEYSDEIASWSESKMGQQVGDGECWTLANEALKAIGTKASSMGREACMSSQSYVHGALIYSYIPATSPYPDPRGGIREASVARGDILQLLSAYFKSKDGRSEKWAGAPDHTAVVVGVKPNDVLSVVEQNIGGVKKVREGTYDMSELVKGEVRIFRAVGEGWVGKLEPKW